LNYAQRRTHGLVISKIRGSAKLILDLDNSIDSWLFLGAYEQESIDAFERKILCLSPSIFVDIGANIGLYTILFGRKFNFERILAFEPDPQNYAQLMGNLYLNGCCEFVEVFNAALGDEVGTAELNRSCVRHVGEMGKTNKSTSRIVTEASEEFGERKTVVPVRRLDDLLSTSNKRIAIKIDVEGYEEAALRGMKQTLTSNECVLLIEIWARKFASVDAFLMGLGYAGTKVDQNRDDYIYLKAGTIARSPIVTKDMIGTA
jgi:FkbM family methyltransferase